MPDDDDDDEDDDEEDDMAARLGLSPGLGLGQESSSQPPSRLMPSVPGVGTLGSWPEGRGQSESKLYPLHILILAILILMDWRLGRILPWYQILSPCPACASGRLTAAPSGIFCKPMPSARASNQHINQKTLSTNIELINELHT